jgi:hypothetical protein
MGVLDHWGGERQAGTEFVTLCSIIPWQADCAPLEKLCGAWYRHGMQHD